MFSCVRIALIGREDGQWQGKGIPRRQPLMSYPDVPLLYVLHLHVESWIISIVSVQEKY